MTAKNRLDTASLRVISRRDFLFPDYAASLFFLLVAVGIINLARKVRGGNIVEKSKTKICNHCGKPLLEDATFCIYCGSKVEDVVPFEERENSGSSESQFAECPRCGKPFGEGNAFCIFCGTPVAASRDMTGKDFQVPEARACLQNKSGEKVPKVRKDRTVAMAVGCTILLIALLVGWNWIQNGKGQESSANPVEEQNSAEISDNTPDDSEEKVPANAASLLSEIPAGIWTPAGEQPDDWENGWHALHIVSIDEEKLTFFLEKVSSAPSSRIATTEAITVSFADGKAKFFVEDSWNNTGSGTIQLVDKETIHISVAITDPASDAMWDVEMDADFSFCQSASQSSDNENLGEIADSENYQEYMSYVSDTAGFFSQKTVETICRYNAQFDNACGSIVGVITVLSLHGENMEDFVYEAGEDLGLGSKDICLLVDAQTEKWQIAVSGGTMEKISDDEFLVLKNSTYDNFYDSFFAGEADEVIISLFKDTFAPWYEQVADKIRAEDNVAGTQEQGNVPAENIPANLGTTKDDIEQEFNNLSYQNGASFSVANAQFILEEDEKSATFQFESPAPVSFSYSFDGSYGEISIDSAANSAKITELANATFLILSRDETSEEFKELPSQVWEQEPIKETYNHPDCAAGLAPLYAASDYKECVRETYTSSYPVSGYTCNFYLYHDYIALHSGKTGDAYSGKITFTKG